jgi:uncharacterized membrane protein YqgA involved in biofilm formation
MTGTLINVAAILVGGALGMLFGSRLPERVRQTVIAALGLFTCVIGIQMTFKTEQSLVVLGALLVGGMLGEWWRLEDGLRNFGMWLEERFAGGTGDEHAGPDAPAQGSRFVRGFLTASLVYCIGPMAILGSIQDGLSGDFSLLAIKSVLDGFASLAFASSLGVGVLFSIVPTLIYQGSISLLAAQAQAAISPAMMNEMVGTGGVLLLGVGLSGLLEIKPIRVGNLLPSLAVAPIIVAILVALGLM